MASLLANAKIIYQPNSEVRGNKPTIFFYHSKCFRTSQYYYETFLNKIKENNPNTVFKKVVALESTKAVLLEKSLQKSCMFCWSPSASSDIDSLSSVLRKFGIDKHFITLIEVLLKEQLLCAINVEKTTQ